MSFCPWTRPRGSAELAALETERKFHEEIAVFELAPEIEIGARRAVAERILPVDRVHHPLDIGGRQSGGIEPADYRAHAAARDGVNRDAVCLEHLEYADVRGAARATAREHETDARASGRRTLRPIKAAIGSSARSAPESPNSNTTMRAVLPVLWFIFGGGTLPTPENPLARIDVRGDNRPPNHAYSFFPRSVAAARSVRCRSGRYRAERDARNPVANDVVVTGMRDPRSAARTPASVSRIDEETLVDIAPKHQAEVLNTSPGVYVQRGSGSESLGAIRSPVLTGAGACGAFLMAEDSLPIRPVGFCNLNEMFELNYEQAAVVEVLRGPGSALFGASAVHGIVNVLTPDVGALPPRGWARRWVRTRSVGIDFGGPRRSSTTTASARTAPGRVRRAGAIPRESMKPSSTCSPTASSDKGRLRVRAAGTVLNQETAGFIQGYESYRDEDIAKSNPNPEAYRDASSARVAVHWDAADVFGEGSELSVAALYRRSRMDFIQHFLIGKPFEHNAQTSYLLSGTASFPFDELTARVALDAETASSELTEFQPGPATDGAPPANAIRPAGLHYDYQVDSWTLGATASLEYRISDAFTATAALRADQTNYDYDNLMIDGNTAGERRALPRRGLPVLAPGRSQRHFDNFAPRITLSWQPNAENLVYVNGSTGFRPPEMTEMYRLQRQQTDAELDSEELESRRARLEISRPDRILFDVALFSMNKDNVILRETNGFNVSNGSTRHRGRGISARPASDDRQREAGGDVRRHRSRGTSTRSRAPSRAARRSSRAMTWTRRRTTSIHSISKYRSARPTTGRSD